MACVTKYCVKKAILSVVDKGKKFGILYSLEMDFTYIDALSKLITILLRAIMNGSSEYLEKVLEGVLWILIMQQRKINEFSPRPYFRFFINLITDF